MKRRLLALSLCAALLLPPSPARGAEAPSDWAANAVTWLQGTGKLTEADFTGYDRTVTRADFARLGVILYELITGMPKPDPADVKNPFTDTSDPDILRAYKIKLVSGTGDGTTFSPGDPVNREQIAVMLLRVLDACKVTYSQADVSAVTFSDEADLSSWAAEAVKRIRSGEYDVIILNFANCDMVGHTGVYEAARLAVETVDECVSQVVEATQKMGGITLITADHGNADRMLEDDGKTPYTAHTTNLVPFYIVGANVKLRNGRLCDIAPALRAVVSSSAPPRLFRARSSGLSCGGSARRGGG